jgi:hypothetical protein
MSAEEIRAASWLFALVAQFSIDRLKASKKSVADGVQWAQRWIMAVAQNIARESADGHAHKLLKWTAWKSIHFDDPGRAQFSEHGMAESVLASDFL